MGVVSVAQSVKETDVSVLGDAWCSFEPHQNHLEILLEDYFPIVFEKDGTSLPQHGGIKILLKLPIE